MCQELGPPPRIWLVNLAGILMGLGILALVFGYGPSVCISLIGVGCFVLIFRAARNEAPPAPPPTSRRHRYREPSKASGYFLAALTILIFVGAFVYPTLFIQ